MRLVASVSLLGLLAACELQPAPKKQAEPAPPEPAQQPPQEAAKPIEPPPVAAGGDAAKIAISGPCLAVAAKVAQVFIDSAQDPAQKSIYEQERANMTRRTGEACTQQGWSEAALTCYLATKTPAEIKACELKFPGQPAPPQRPPVPDMPPAKP